MSYESIGGYFSLELNAKKSNHLDEKNCILLNTARNCLEYILETREYKLVYIPLFTCEVILEPFLKLNIKYEFYSINENLEPIFDFNSIGQNEAFLYTNYFGVKDKFVEKLSRKKINLIIDNAQSFFSLPLNQIDTFYSARKFVGVSDGGYLYTTKHLNRDIEKDISFNRMEHLIRRIDTSAEESYDIFKKNDICLNNQTIKRMSKLTESILKSIDYEFVKSRRLRNFYFLHNKLKISNKFIFDLDENQVPLVYPYWTNDNELKTRLLKNKIYCPTYWPNIKEWCDNKSLEFKLVDEVVYLPIDQRYNIEEMEIIIKHVQG